VVKPTELRRTALALIDARAVTASSARKRGGGVRAPMFVVSPLNQDETTDLGRLARASGELVRAGLAVLIEAWSTEWYVHYRVELTPDGVLARDNW
jgi:hypothetical protein